MPAVRPKGETRDLILQYVKGNPHCSISEIAESVGVRPAAVSYHIDKLFDEELVHRVKGIHRSIVAV